MAPLATLFAPPAHDRHDLDARPDGPPAGVLTEVAPGVRVWRAHGADDHYAWLPKPPEWHTAAVCRGLDQTTFYGTESDDPFSLTRAAMDHARRICDTCPVRRACLQWSLTAPEPYGVWGGVSGRGRERMWRRIRTEQITVTQLLDEYFR